MRIKVLSGGRKNIELSLSDAELNFQMRRIGIEETVPMCRLVEVSEKDNPLHRFEGQTVNMDEVNFFAKRMESLTEYERKVLSAYAEDYGVATMKDLINLTFSMKGLSLLTDFSDARQVGVRLYMAVAGRRTKMVQLVEITGVLNEKGCIEIPIVLLAQTGIRTGEEVNLIYLAAGEKDYRNESREFMLKRAEEDPLEELQSGETELKLPPQLLADAHIPLDADLDIVCLDRKIVILPTEDVESEDVPKELLDICADLGIPREKVNIVLRMTEEENGKKQILSDAKEGAKLSK